MPQVPPPKPPLTKAPTFRTTAAGTEVVFAEGTPATLRQLGELVRWTGLKLTIALERYPFEWSQDREPRVPAVRALIRKLAAAAKWKQLQISQRRFVPPAKAFKQAAFDAEVKKLALQRFNANSPSPIIFARTGKADDVQYEWSLAITDLAVYVFAFDTQANRTRMNGLFDAVRAAHEAAPWATLGHGYGGRMTAARVGFDVKWGVKPAFFDHDEAQLAPPWRMHIGRLWLDVPAVARRVDGFVAKNAKLASVDRDGLLVEMAAPKSATDRAAPRMTAVRRGFEPVRKAALGLVNDALHDPKQRKQLL